VRLAEADPSNAQAQRDLSISYNQLGQMMVAVGNLGEAERFYRDGLAILARLAEADPSNVANVGAVEELRRRIETLPRGSESD
jgi:Flp pilus assembly protein TadD